MGSLFAQTILPKRLEFYQICAGDPHPEKPGEIFNEYQASFSITGFTSTETFEVELSDINGSFATATTKTTILPPLKNTPPDTDTDKTIVFAIPTNLVGSDTYRLRIKSSTGKTSQSFTYNGSGTNTYFPAYYKSYNGSFFINDKKPSVSFCSGGSVTLTVYNPTPTIAESSPANFPHLIYNWYKDDVLIAGQSKSSLVVNSPGVYYAKLNYGPCSSDNYSSQRVIVSSSSGSGGGSTISSSLGNPFCSGSENTTLTADAGNSYVWKKDGAVIVGATDQTYKTNSAGVYTCDIDFGGCNVTATIDLKTTATITANDKEVNEGETLLVAQGGDPLTVTAIATVSNPTYQWFHNNELIADATQNTLDITVAGNYKVNISGCTMSFIVKYSTVIDYNVPKISNIITPNNDGTNDTWIIPNVYNNTNTHVVILSSLGEIVFESDNYDNSNGWPQSNIEFKNFNPVYYYIITPNGGSAKKGSITLLK